MKRERVGREPKFLGDVTRGHALRSGLHQQAEDFQPVFLGKSGQGRDGVCFFHISANIEITAACQDGFRLDMAAGTFKMIYKERFRRLSGSAVGHEEQK